MRYAVVFLALLMLAVPALAADISYPVPDVSKAKLVLEEKQIVSVADGKTSTEMDIKTYKTVEGALVRVYSVKGAIFRYDVSPTGSEPYEYRIIDTKGNGVFDTKEEMVGMMEVQGRKGKYFIDLGPEPGKEYKYSWEKPEKPSMKDEKDRLMGFPIYIPQWVIARWMTQ